LSRSDPRPGGAGFPDTIAIASRNRGKIREILSICADWPVEWVRADRDRRDWPDVEETGATYLENALMKARVTSEALGLPALADDSGIEVDTLGGAPGPRSARFAAPDASDEENLRKLIELITPVPEAGRGARYRCVAALIVPDHAGTWAEGECHGRLVLDPRGSGGFGYDPIFVPAGLDRTMAELEPEEKDRISHRGRAFRSLRDLLASAGRAGGA
jgi:XTP/dITP diphosphohydrolase